MVDPPAFLNVRPKCIFLICVFWYPIKETVSENIIIETSWLVIFKPGVWKFQLEGPLLLYERWIHVPERINGLSKIITHSGILSLNSLFSNLGFLGSVNITKYILTVTSNLNRSLRSLTFSKDLDKYYSCDFYEICSKMLMWRRSLPPFTWLVKPSVGRRQSHNFPRYNCLWGGAELGLVDLLYKKSHWKQTNKWKVWGKTLTWGAPHGHPEKESGENISRKEARKTCHLLQSRTWSTLEAQNIHSKDVEKVVRSQPSESSQKKRKQIPCAKTYFYTQDFGRFPLQTLRQTPPTPNRSHGVLFFFSFPLLFFWKPFPQQV